MKILLLLPLILIGLVAQQAFADVQLNGPAQYFNQINGTIIDTEHGKVKLNSDGSYSFYEGNQLIFTDKIVAKYADVSNLNSWTYPATLNNDTPDNLWNGTYFVTDKIKSGVGKLSYKYFNDGTKWKTQLEATNLSSLTTKAFGFDQIFDIETDTIKFGGQNRNLDNFNGQTFDRTWLVNNQGKVLDFMSNHHFDFDIAFDDLYSVTVQNTGPNKSRLIFDYRTSDALLPNQTLILDPAITQDGAVVTSRTTKSPSIVIGSNSNRLLLAQVSWSGVATSVSSVKIGTTSFTKAASATASGGNFGTDIWYLIAPATGNRTVDVTFSSGSPNYAIALVSLYNVDQTTGINTSATNSTGANNGSTRLIKITPTNTGSWIIAGLGDENGSGGSPSGTNFYTSILDSSSASFHIITQYKSSPTIGSANTLSWSAGGAGHWNIVAVEVKPFPVCTAPTFNKLNTLNTTAFSLQWTVPSPACSPSGYKIFQSKNDASYTLATTLGNVTSTTMSSLDTGTKYAFKILAINSAGDGSSNSTIKTNSTLPIAPSSLTATPISKTKINVDYSDGTQPNVLWYKSRYSTGGAWTNFSTNSSAHTPRYENFTGLTEYTAYNMQIASGTIGGWGAWSSNVTATTYTSTSGTLTFDYTNIGNVFLFNGTLASIHASPTPATATQLDIIDNGTSTSYAISTSLPNGATVELPAEPYEINDNYVHQIKLRLTMTNNTGTVTTDTATQNITIEYDPSYVEALDPTQGFVNYTISRTSDQDNIILKTNRDLSLAQFQIECRYRSMTDAALNTGGVWHNYTGVYFMNDTLTDAAGTHYYIDCYNDGLLFQTISYTNSSMLLAGIQVFDDTYGTFIGVPVGVFFIVLVAGMANQRTAPMWIVVILAIAGIMSAIGFFTLETNVWALALIAALLGIIVGRKLF